MFIKSMRWRLQFWQAFLLIGILSGFGMTAYQLNRTNRFRQLDEELQRRLAAVSTDLRGGLPFNQPPGRPPFEPGRPERRRGEDFGRGSGRPPFEEGRDGPPPPGPDAKGPPGWMDRSLEYRDVQVSASVLSLFDPVETNGFYFAIWSRGGTLLRSSSNAPPGLPLPGRLSTDTLTHTRMRETSREAFHFTEMGDCVLVGRRIAADLHAMARFGWWLAAAGAAVLALGLGGGWLMATRAIRPVEDISAAASRISAGNLSERIPVADPESELGRLAGVLNSTFARLEAAFAQQQRFTADASHELRTPIAVLISEAQTTLARERSAAEYRAAVEVCLDAAQQMRRLSQSLLELARYDAGQEPVKRTPFDLAEQARAGVERVGVLARERNIQIHCDLTPVEVRGDADRLGQVITNLLTNAVQYNRDGGDIRVTTCRENGVAVLTVADGGPGLAPEDLPHVFERFYRGDKSRARAEGHCGLGLAICQAIVEAHGGRIEVASQPGAGAKFTVRLPA